MIAMFDGIKPKTFLNTPEERHAFLIGFFEVLCPWPARYKGIIDDTSPLKGEEHYYLAGRALGFPVLLLILIALAKLTKEVLL